MVKQNQALDPRKNSIIQEAREWNDSQGELYTARSQKVQKSKSVRSPRSPKAQKSKKSKSVWSPRSPKVPSLKQIPPFTVF